MLAFGRCCFLLQLKHACIVRDRVLDPTHRYAGADQVAGVQHCRFDDPIHRCPDRDNTGIDDGLAADPHHELLISREGTHTEQRCRQCQLCEAAPLNTSRVGACGRMSRSDTQISCTWVGKLTVRREGYARHRCLENKYRMR